MNEVERFPWRQIGLTNPFVATQLPFLAKLYKIGFHRYQRRWAKRLFKRPGRMLFNLAYNQLKLGGHGILEFRSGGIVKKLVFDARSLHFSSVYSYGHDQIFEPQVMGLLASLISGNETFLDIGANWGMEALHAALLPNWHGPIHAFEPIPSTYKDLASLVKQAGLDNRIHCHNLALSDRSGRAEMHYSDGINSGTATLSGGEYNNDRFQINLAPLDELELPDPTFIKVDVEGHEANVFNGAKNTIARSQPFIIFETWHTEQDHRPSEEAFQVLERLGYVFFRPAWGKIDGDRTTVWSLTQPPPGTGPILNIIPMSKDLRPFMSEHIDVFACHVDKLDDLRSRFSSATDE